MRTFLTNEAEVGFALITVNIFQCVVRKFETNFAAICAGTIFTVLSDTDESLALKVLIFLN